MKKLSATLSAALLLLAAHNVQAQAPGISWKNIYSYIPATEYGSYVEPTTDGGYIVGATSASHLWVFKLDGSGTKQWEKYLSSGTGVVSVYAVKQTSDNGYVVAGTDYSTGASDSTGNHGIRDMLVVKFNSSGDVQWKKAFGGSNNEEAYTIQQTSDGGYIVGGITASNDGQVTGWQGNTDYWIVKLDASGNLTWQKSLGGANYDYATAIIQTTDGGYMVAGYSGSKNGDVTGTHWGGSDDDIWVAKLDASGAITWQKSYGGSAEDQAHSVRQTTDGGYIIAGSTMSNDGNVTGKHGTSQSNQDCWVIKIDATGTLAWQKCLGGSGSGIGAGSGNDIGYDIRQTTDGGYVVAATVSSGSATNDDITGYHGTTGADYWVVKLDATGSISWQKCLGGGGTEDVRSIAQTSDGGYIVAGTSVFSPDGDVVSPDYSSSHPWIVKLGGTSAAQKIQNGNGITVYPNPATETITFDNIPLGATLHIMDITGKTVWSSAVSACKLTVPTAGLPGGVYIATVNNNGILSQLRFAVNK